MQYPGFVGGSNVVQSPRQDAELTMNWYVEPMEGPGGKAQMALYPTPGVTVFASQSTVSAGRASFAMHDRAFCVIGATFFEVTAGGMLTSRGTVAIDEFPATISTNGDGGGQLFITSGNNGYIFTLATNVLTQVRTGGTRMGAHLDGYFIALDADTSTIYLSDLLDGLTWDPTQFAQRSIKPDPWVSMAVVDRYLHLLGEQTSEIWYDAGSFPFPFAPHPSGLVEYGCGAPFSPKVVGGALYWLAQTAYGRGLVVKSSGFTPQVVSTYAVQLAFEAAGDVSDAIGSIEERLGHAFYLLHLPFANQTKCYDATANDVPASMRWTDRGTWNADAQRYDAWRPIHPFYAFGAVLTLDRAGTSVYRLTNDTYTDVDGLPIRRVRRAPGLWRENQRIFVTAFEVHCDTGLGAVSGQGSTPEMALRHSGDGGYTWGAERWRSAGALGQYGARVQWQLCGSGRQWVPEVVVTDPIAWRITGASVTLAQAGRAA